MENNYDTTRLALTIDTLLSENGCDWDKEQTFLSLLPCLLEETHEVISAVRKNDNLGLKEELGDLLFLILFYSKIAENNNLFSLKQVVDNVTDKMIYRHPHVFLEPSTSLNRDEHLKNWQQLKVKEKKTNKIDIPESLPSLLKALKVINLKNVPLDFEELKLLFAKINHKLSTIENNNFASSDDFGEILFNLVALSSNFDVNLEIALTNTTEKVINDLEHTKIK